MWLQYEENSAKTRCFIHFIIRRSYETDHYSSCYFHIFLFSRLTQRKFQGNEAAKCSLGKWSPIRVCISPNSQKSLVECDWSKVENGGEDCLGKQKKRRAENISEPSVILQNSIRDGRKVLGASLSKLIFASQTQIRNYEINLIKMVKIKTSHTATWLINKHKYKTYRCSKPHSVTRILPK